MTVLTSALTATTKMHKLLSTTCDTYSIDLKQYEELSNCELTKYRERIKKIVGKVQFQVGNLEVAMEKLSIAAERLDDEDEDSEKLFEEEASKVWECILRGKELYNDMGMHLKRAEKPQEEVETVQITRSFVDEEGEYLQGSKMRAPTLKIPKFAGDRWQFTNFWTIYEETIHKSNLSNLLKFNHLISYLEGEAKELMSRFRLSDENYPKAVAMLKTRYDNKAATVTELNRKLKDVKANNDSVREQRKLWDQMFVILDQLKTLEEDIESNMLKDSIICKFSLEIQKEIYEKRLNLNDESEWTMEQLSLDIEKIITKQEKLQDYLKEKAKEKDSWNKRDDRKYSSPRKFRRNEDEKNSENKSSRPECLFCEGTHWGNNCKIITDPKERSDICRKKKACLICLKTDHSANNCKLTQFACKKCKEHKHHHTLCFMKSDQFSRGTGEKTQEKSSEKPKGKMNNSAKHANVAHTEETPILEAEGNQREENTVATVKSKNRAYLPTLCVDAYNPRSEKWEKISIMVDTGSDDTYITTGLANKWNLPRLNETNKRVRRFGEIEATPGNYLVTEIHIRTKTSKLTIIANATEVLAGQISKAKWSEEDMKFALKEQLSVNEESFNESSSPQMLLGCDYLCDIIGGKLVKLPSGICVWETTAGYMTMGRPSKINPSKEAKEAERESEISPIIMMTHTGDQQMELAKERESQQKQDSQMKTEEEFSGSLKDEKAEMERKTIEHFKNNVEKREDGYYVRLPFKEQGRKLPSNYAIAIKRLQSVLKHQPTEVLKQIDDIFQDQLSKGIIEEVDGNTPGVGITHYNPHQPVLTPNKTTTKCRVVVDGSSHFAGEPSLNDIIHQGPVILPELIHMLIRFRGGKTAILSDVEKAFLQVRLHESDRDATRVIWVKDVTKPAIGQNIVIFRFTRVLFGLNVSPYLLAATILHHLEQHTNQELAREVAINLYVDNLILTTDDDSQKARETYVELKEIFNELRMNLREFISNSQEFNAILKEADKSKESLQKVLGIYWDTTTDEIKMKVDLPAQKSNSRRTISSMVAAEYDPLGFTVPLMLGLKLFQRELWNGEYDWDTPLTAEHEDEWQRLISVREGYERSLPRHVIEKSGNNKLVVFSDASQEAAAFAIYVVNEMGSSLIFAKSKVRQKKERWTIPKLEMEALAMAVIHAKSVWKAFTDGNINVEEIIFMADSEIVLQWLKIDPTRKEVGVLVTNRLKTVHEIISEVERACSIQFGYVNTKENPADLGTRGLEKDQMDTELWWKGPNFIKNPIEEWPYPEKMFRADSETQVCLLTLRERKEKNESERNFDFNITNSFKKMKRTAGYVLKFVNELINALPKERQAEIRRSIPELTTSTKGALTAEEIKAGERLLIKDHQKEIDEKLINEMIALRPKVNPEGIIVSQGRMANAEMDYEAKEPIILLPNSQLSKQVIQDCHGKWHKGIDHTMSEVQKKFWIPKLRSQVKKILKACVHCQRMMKLPYRYPDTPQLPYERVAVTRPFENVGLDYFGPLEYIKEDGTIGKAYGCLITCSVTRLLHVELVSDETTYSFLQALRRFIALRGVPKRIISDNAPTFVLGSEIMIDAATKNSLSQEVKEFLGQEEIIWKFITPYSPWKGGFYERMVKTTKHAFLKGMKSHTKKMTFEEMATCFSEVSASINTRPLTYIEDEVNSRILRPCDFIYTNMTCSIPFEDILDQVDEYRPSQEAQLAMTRTETIRALSSSVEASEKVWKLWKDKYLTQLRETHKIRIDKKRGKPEKPRVGQMVIICDEDQPRQYWRLGLITELVASSDGEIREVCLKVKPRKRPCGTIRRSINLLVPMEIEEDDKDVTEETETDHESSEEPKTEEKESRYNLRRRKPVNYQEENNTFMGMSCPKLGIDNTLLISMIALICMIPGGDAAESMKKQEIECTKNGLRIHEAYESFEVCAENYCTDRTRFRWNPSDPLEVWIPLAIKTRTHRITIKAFDGKEVHIWEQTCQAVSTCEAIDCTFCVNNIANPECNPYGAWIALGAFLYVFAMMFYCCFYVPITLGGPVKLFCWGLTLIAKLIYRMGKTLVPTRRRRLAWPKTGVIGIVLAIIGLSLANACQEVDIINQEIRECQEGGDVNCTFTSETFLKLNSINREACIRLLINGTVFEEIRVELLEIQLRCVEESVLFTREVETKVWSTKRCPHMGSCSNDKCLKINPNSMIPELEATKEYVGTTGCMESCGGPGCDCFFPSSACLFYRIYGIPLSDDVFELFKCSQWMKSILVKIRSTSLNSKNNKAEEKLWRLPINYPTKVTATTVTATSLDFPINNMMDSWFIRNSTMIGTWQRGQLPAYQCYTKPKARKNECQLRERCTCSPAETEVRCTCEHPTIEEHFKKIERRLPTQEGFMRIQERKGKIEGSVSDEISSEITIRREGSTDIEILRSRDTCSIQDSHITGCYSCAKGGEAKVTCFSKKQATIATIRCQGKLFSVSCSPTGFGQTLTFFTSEAQFHKKCSVECGGPQRNFKITGIMKFTGSIWTSLYRLLDSNTTIYNEVNIPDLNHLADGFLTFFKTGLIVFITVLGVFMCTYLLVFSVCAALLRRIIWTIVRSPFRLGLHFFWSWRGRSHKSPRHTL